MKAFMRRWAGFAVVPVCVALLGAAGVAGAATTKKVRCEVKEGGKTHIKHVATADECTKMGGTVAPAKKSSTK